MGKYQEYKRAEGLRVRLKRITDLAVIYDAIEVRPRKEIREGGCCRSMVKEEFWRQKHERLLVRPVHLTAEGVEQLRRRCCVDHEKIGLALSVSPYKLDHELIP